MDWKDYTRFNPKEILPRFDEFLAQKGKEFDAVVIGAGALGVIGILSRNTIDFDVLDPKIPDEILSLADEFRQSLQKEGIYLHPKWINNGPDSLLMNLPHDWKTRIETFYKGNAITFHTLGRAELIKDKLWGFCDERRHDKVALINMKAKKEELLEAALWVKEQDGYVRWSEVVDQAVEELFEALGYEK